MLVKDRSAPLTAAQRRFMLIVLMLTYTISFIDRTIINVLVQPIKIELELSDSQIGIVCGAAFGILYAVMGVPLARIADRSSRLRLIAMAMTFWSAMTAMCGLAVGFWSLFAARMGVGIGEAAGTPAAQSIISDIYAPEERPGAMSVYSMGVPIGILAGALIGGWVGQQFGWRMAFILVGAPGILLALVIAFALREPSRGTFDRPSGGDTPVGLAQAAGILLKNPAYRWLCLAFTFAAIAGYSLTLFMVAYLQRRLGITLLDASFAYGIASGVTGLVGMTLGGFLTNHLMKRDRRAQCWVPATALTIAGPCFMIGLVLPDTVGMALLIIAGATFYPMYIGPGYAAAHALVDARMRATATAILLLCSTLIGSAIGPALTGWLSDTFAAASYGDGFVEICKGAAVDVRCRGALSTGLQTGLFIISTAYFGGGLSFYLAGTRMSRALSR